MFALAFCRSSIDRCAVVLRCSISSIDQDRSEALRCFCKFSCEMPLDRILAELSCESVRRSVCFLVSGCKIPRAGVAGSILARVACVVGTCGLRLP